MVFFRRLLGNNTVVYLLAMVLGYVIGVLLPRHNAILHAGVDFAINTYQVPVIPFIVVNIICAIGKLDAFKAKRLLLYIILGVLGMWLVLDAIIFASSLLFAVGHHAAHLLPAVEAAMGSVSLLDVLIPSNRPSAKLNTGRAYARL